MISLYTQRIIYTILLSLTIIGLQTTIAQNSEIASCSSINRNIELSELDLPENAQLIVHNRNEQSLSLVNLLNNTSTMIPQTSGIIHAYLFDNDQRLLVVREFDELDLAWIWQTINLADFWTRVVWLENTYEIDGISIQPSNQLRYSSEDEAYLIDLLTGRISVFPTPEWIDPFWETQFSTPAFVIRYNPTFERVAYNIIIRDDPSVNSAIRIQTLATNEYVDIPDIGFPTWSPNGGLISGEVFFSELIHIYDSFSGELLYEIGSPLDQFKVWHTGIWSASSDMLVIGYKRDRDANEEFLYTYDLATNQWMEHCFVIDGRVYYDLRQDGIFWTIDSRFVWWREETAETNIFNIVVADIETGAYGVVARDVGILSKFSTPITPN